LVPYAALGDSDLNDFPWMMKIKWRQLDYIRGHHENGVRVSSENMPKQHFDTTHIFGMASGAAGTRAEGAVVKELYIKPSITYPKGLHLIGANGVILQQDDYPFTEYNLEQFKDIEVPGVFWGMATMELGIQLQKSWNRTVTGVDEFNRVLGKGKGLVPRGANLEAMPDDTHGEWIVYKPVMGHKPEYMNPKGLPRTYDLMLTILTKSFQDLFSQQEVTKGTNKSDIRSGEMVELLLEQNAMGAIPTNSIFEEGLEGSMGRVLRRIQSGYKTNRMLKVIGNEGEFELFDFKGADLRNNTDVHVKRESSLPESRVARNIIVERRFKERFYGDPMDPEVRRHVMNMLDDAIVKDAYADTRLDETNARAENLVMAQGQITRYLINDYDDHMIHVRELNHYRKGRDHQNLRFENPQKFGELESIF
ncbi:hypothetical protein LCGC14_2757920, partial [marine sediment metagenome]